MDYVVIIGLGQLGRVFAAGLLRIGHVVIPVNRGDDLQRRSAEYPTPTLVLVAVAEKDLPSVLAQMPAPWKSRLGFLQNELLPRDWLKYGIEYPTIVSVWFEKKKGMDAKPLIASPAFGPQAERLTTALLALELPAVRLDTPHQLLWELVRKNLYILTTNLAGLETQSNVSTLWQQHRVLAEAVAHDVLDLQEWLTGEIFERTALLSGMLAAFQADPEHTCAGRSAPARLARALGYANQAGLAVTTLRDLAARHLPS
ncbi:MAG: hypothetical protein KGZ83_07975 [Sulfuricella sp.]|nr:hypothetical protein [Sulfuricella sp.]